MNQEKVAIVNAAEEQKDQKSAASESLGSTIKGLSHADIEFDKEVSNEINQDSTSRFKSKREESQSKIIKEIPGEQASKRTDSKQSKPSNRESVPSQKDEPEKKNVLEVPPISVEDKVKMFKTALTMQSKSRGTKQDSSSFDPNQSITTYTSNDKSGSFGQTQESGYLPNNLRKEKKEKDKLLKQRMDEALNEKLQQEKQKELEDKIQDWKEIVKERKQLYKQMLERVAEDDDEPNHPLKNKQSNNKVFQDSKKKMTASHTFVSEKLNNPRKVGGKLAALRIVNERAQGGRAGVLKRKQEERANGRITVEFFRNPTSKKQKGQTLQEKMEVELIDLLKMRTDLEDIDKNTRNPRLYLDEFKNIHSDEMVMAAYMNQLKNLKSRARGRRGNVLM